MNTVASHRCYVCGRPVEAEGECSYCLLQLGKNVPQSWDGQPPPSSMLPEDLQRSFPQLDITRLIGQGGMGAIYHARQKSLDRDVALKIIASHTIDDPAFAERFAREAKTLAKLSHPHIVSVYDFGTTEDGLVYLLMEYVEGVNLREAMEAGGISPQEALQIVREMCMALQFAHDRGVVHRDIKPENVLLNEQGEVKVADFGLAKLVGNAAGPVTLTHTRQVMGTLRYMAPEQFENPSGVDHRADVYALGVVFYELLTGQVPAGRFEPPSQLAPGLASQLDAIVMRSLERRPTNRYQRVSEFAQELSNINVDMEPVHSLPPVVPPCESLSVPFTIDLMGSLAQAIGNITLSSGSLEINYRTRDNFFKIIRSSPCSIQIPIGELSKLEWRPGVFWSTVTLGTKSLTYMEDFPGSDPNQTRLTISQTDSCAAARLVHEAARREPSLRNNSTSKLTEQIANSPLELTWSRFVFSVSLFICAALNIVGMILLLVTLSTTTSLGREQQYSVEVILALVFIPILTTCTVIVQIVGGVFTLSPFTRRVPMAAAIVSMVPLAPAWPLGLCVGLWGCKTLRSENLLRATAAASAGRRSLPVLDKDRKQKGNRPLRTTLMIIRESRWSQLIAIANVAALLLVGLLWVGYQVGCYPVTLRYRLVDDEPWSDDLQRVDARLEHLPIMAIDRAGTSFPGGKHLTIRCLKWTEPQVHQALANVGPVEWAWMIDGSQFDNHDLALHSGGTVTANVGGRINSENGSIEDTIKGSVQLAGSPVPFQLNELTSISTKEGQLVLRWTQQGRAAVIGEHPGVHAVGLALLVDGLVEGVAFPDAIDNRGATFSLAHDANLAAGAVEAALRGPQLPSPLELIDRD